MIRLTFSVPEPGTPWRETWRLPAGRQAATISEMDLRYKCFMAAVEFVVNDLVVVSPASPLTVVDLALAFRTVERRLAAGEDAAFGFTEDREVIRLRGPGATISIGSSEKPEQTRVEREQLIPVLAAFRRSVHQRVVDEVPALAANPVIQTLPSAVS